MRDWGVSNQLTWTPGPTNLGQFAIQVWVRDMGASLDYEDWRGTELFTITQSTSLTLTMNRSLSGLRSGDPVTFIAQATGGNGNWDVRVLGLQRISLGPAAAVHGEPEQLPVGCLGRYPGGPGLDPGAGLDRDVGAVGNHAHVCRHTVGRA